ncbi:hypothetical protein [Nostoc sp. 'Lobaria pulmonaria (5183) cyanobiont']|uniref:hypothetical protein n=1 Tax=Nostoc sp. 'Lobaria pulmonaria (5183) cyanobiont' TaxID=1618022 RepID=UPI001319B8DB|nr:hypothetical protein [Nostoc sp. 'Lobaria pulmonaria (5183) cyanobiont']
MDTNREQSPRGRMRSPAGSSPPQRSQGLCFYQKLGQKGHDIVHDSGGQDILQIYNWSLKTLKISYSK